MTGAANAVNVLSNGGFESGNTSNWYVYNPAGQALTWGADNTTGKPRTGSWCGKLSAFGGTSSMLTIYNTASIANYVPGTMIKAELYLKTENLTLSSASDGVGVFFRIDDAAGNVVASCADGVMFKGTHGYAKIQYLLEMPPNGAMVLLGISLNSGITGGTIYWDDATVEPVQNATPNFLTNGGFEQTWTTGWAQWPTANFTVSNQASGQKEGSYCLNTYMNSSATGGALIQDLGNLTTLYGVQPGDHLRFSAWYKTGTDVGASEYVSLAKYHCTNGLPDGSTLAITNQTGQQTSWKQIILDFPHLGSPYNSLRVFLSSDGCLPGPSTIYWDDARLEKDEYAGELSTALPVAQVANDAGGTPRLKIDNVTKTPAFFFCNSGSSVISDEVAKAATAGVNFVQIPMQLPWAGSNTGLIAQVLDANPNALIIPRISIYPPEYWKAAHPEYYLNENGNPPADGAQPSLASAAYLAEVKHQLDHFVRWIHNSGYKDKIIGYHLGYLSGNEWFYPSTDSNYFDFSAVSRTQFQAWCQATYGTIAAVNSAWGTAYGAFTDIVIPSSSNWDTGDDGFFRNPAVGMRRQIADFQECFNQRTSDAIIGLSQKIKDLTGGKSLTAAFMGYQNELIANAWTRGQVHAGHQALRRLTASSAIDIICSPVSYYDRDEGKPMDMMSIVDAVSRAGKIYLQEDDMRTYLWPNAESSLFINTEADTLNCLRRDFGNVLSHNQGIWWMDLVANGAWNGQSIWDTNKKCVDSYSDSITNGEAAKPQIALIYDEESNYWLKANSLNLTFANQYEQRSIFQSLGAQVGYYNIEDLPYLPSSVRLIVFVNTFKISSTEQTLINNAKSGNRTFLWMYAPGYVTDSALDMSRMGTLTGFTFSKWTTALNPKVRVVSSGYPVTEGIVDQVFDDQGTNTITPTFYVSGGTYVRLGNYDGTTRCGLAMQFNSGWKSIFCGAAKLNVPVARAIARDAGVNLLDNGDDLTRNDAVTYNGRYMYVYSTSAQNRWFQLPNEEVANGGFERFSGALPTSGYNCWYKASGTIGSSVISTTKRTGNTAWATGSFSSTSGQYSVPLSQRIPMVDGATYDISAWVYVDTLNTANAGAGDYIFLKFQPYAWSADGRAMTIAAGTSNPIANRTWTRFTATYTHHNYSNQYPECMAVLAIYGRYSASNIIVDDVSIKESGSRTVTVTDWMTGNTLTNVSSGTGWYDYLNANEQKIYKLQ